MSKGWHNRRAFEAGQLLAPIAAALVLLSIVAAVIAALTQ
jgi:hypothetical protein